MNLVTFYMYCLDRSCRTVVLACSASDASFFIDCRDKERILILGIFHDQTDGSHRTVSGTSQTFHVVCIYDAKVRIDHCVTCLH